MKVLRDGRWAALRNPPPELPGRDAPRQAPLDPSYWRFPVLSLASCAAGL